MHHGLVRLVLEVTIPARTELLQIVLLQLFFSRPNFHTSLDTIGGQRTSTSLVPLVIDSLLDLRITSNEVIEALDVRLRTIGREGEIMILEIETNTWQLDLALYPSFL